MAEGVFKLGLGTLGGILNFSSLSGEVSFAEADFSDSYASVASGWKYKDSM